MREYRGLSKDEHSRFIFFAGIAAHGSEIGRCAPRALWAYSLCGQTSAESAGGLRSGPMKGAEGTGFRGVAPGETAIASIEFALRCLERV